MCILEFWSSSWCTRISAARIRSLSLVAKIVICTSGLARCSIWLDRGLPRSKFVQICSYHRDYLTYDRIYGIWLQVRTMKFDEVDEVDSYQKRI